MQKIKKDNLICEVKRIEIDVHSKEYFANTYLFVSVRIEGEDFDRTFWLTETEYKNLKV